MKKYIFGLILLIISLFFISGCNKSYDKTTGSDITTTLNVIDLEITNIEVEVGHTKTFTFKKEVSGDLEFDLVNNQIADYQVDDNELTIQGLSIGSTKLEIKYEGIVYKTIDINVIDEVLYLPIPTKVLLLKGVGVSASVKMIITKDELKNVDVTWAVDNPDIVEYETQNNIIHFTSIARGNTKVTVTVGDYSNSFMLYVTNIRGDIE